MRLLQGLIHPKYAGLFQNELANFISDCKQLLLARYKNIFSRNGTSLNAYCRIDRHSLDKNMAYTITAPVCSVNVIGKYRHQN